MEGDIDGATRHRGHYLHRTHPGAQRFPVPATEASNSAQLHALGLGATQGELPFDSIGKSQCIGVELIFLIVGA